jgi:hypothetical protein
MPATTVIQARLAVSLAKRLDQRAEAAGITRAELLRSLLEAALDIPQSASTRPASDPLLGEIADALGTMLAKVDACHTAARSAHAAARLAGLMLLPQDRQQIYINKLAAQVRP